MLLSYKIAVILHISSIKSRFMMIKAKNTECPVLVTPGVNFINKLKHLKSHILEGKFCMPKVAFQMTKFDHHSIPSNFCLFVISITCS